MRLHSTMRLQQYFLKRNDWAIIFIIPQELVDFIGYNPVIELRDDISAEELIADVLENIEIYQSLVDKNRETAEKLGSWKVRMKWLMNELDDLYTLKDISCR